MGAPILHQIAGAVGQRRGKPRQGCGGELRLTKTVSTENRGYEVTETPGRGMRQWIDVMKRDVSHPCIIAWMLQAVEVVIE